MLFLMTLIRLSLASTQLYSEISFRKAWTLVSPPLPPTPRPPFADIHQNYAHGGYRAGEQQHHHVIEEYMNQSLTAALDSSASSTKTKARIAVLPDEETRPGSYPGR